MGIIRILLALSVLTAHAGPLPILGSLLPGSFAVKAFFALSGFYMAMVSEAKYANPAHFYWNRFSRIFSGY